MILPSPTGGGELGVRIVGRPKLPLRMGQEHSPGPGYYNPKYNKLLHSQNAVFGTERRSTYNRLEKTDAREFHVDIFAPTLGSRRNSKGGTFSNGHSLGLASPPISTPGPGYYNSNGAEGATRPSPPSFSISAETWSKANVREELPFLDSRSSVDAAMDTTNFQRFSKLGRFVGETSKRRYNYHRIVFPKKKLDLTIVHKNIEEAQSSTRKNRSMRIFENQTRLRERIGAVLHSKQSIIPLPENERIYRDRRRVNREDRPVPTRGRTAATRQQGNPH